MHQGAQICLQKCVLGNIDLWKSCAHPNALRSETVSLIAAERRPSTSQFFWEITGTCHTFPNQVSELRARTALSHGGLCVALASPKSGRGRGGSAGSELKMSMWHFAMCMKVLSQKSALTAEFEIVRVAGGRLARVPAGWDLPSTRILKARHGFLGERKGLQKRPNRTEGSEYFRAIRLRRIA